MEEEKFTGVTFAVTRTKTGQRITVSGVPRLVVWRSFGTKPHTGPIELPFLLVRNVRRCEGLAETVHNLHKKEVAQHRWDRIAMDILDVCDPTPDGYHYTLVIADYFSKWTEAFPIKNKCADTVADVLVKKIILRFGMPLADGNGVIWRKRSLQGSRLQLLVPRPARESLFQAYHASLFGGHLGRNRTLARLSYRFYWSGMSDDVKDWLRQCTTCIKRKSPNIDGIELRWIYLMFVTQHRTVIITPLLSLTTLVNGLRLSRLRISVLTRWQTCW